MPFTMEELLACLPTDDIGKFTSTCEVLTDEMKAYRHSETHDTLLHAAIEHKAVSCALWLIDRGIDTSLLNKRKKRPIELAHATLFTELFNALLNKGGYISASRLKQYIQDFYNKGELAVRSKIYGLAGIFFIEPFDGLLAEEVQLMGKILKETQLVYQKCERLLDQSGEFVTRDIDPSGTLELCVAQNELFKYLATLINLARFVLNGALLRKTKNRFLHPTAHKSAISYQIEALLIGETRFLPLFTEGVLSLLSVQKCAESSYLVRHHSFNKGLAKVALDAGLFILPLTLGKVRAPLFTSSNWERTLNCITDTSMTRDLKKYYLLNPFKTEGLAFSLPTRREFGLVKICPKARHIESLLQTIAFMTLSDTMAKYCYPSVRKPTPPKSDLFLSMPTRPTGTAPVSRRAVRFSTTLPAPRRNTEQEKIKRLCRYLSQLKTSWEFTPFSYFQKRAIQFACKIMVPKDISRLFTIQFKGAIAAVSPLLHEDLKLRTSKSSIMTQNTATIFLVKPQNDRALALLEEHFNNHVV